ncbi:hypothetical protein KI387_018037, partial [Taxus chinensis]
RSSSPVSEQGKKIWQGEEKLLEQVVRRRQPPGAQKPACNFPSAESLAFLRPENMPNVLAPALRSTLQPFWNTWPP